MTDAGTDDAFARAKARRRRARRVMQAMTLACVLAAAGIGAGELYSGGWQSFLERPAGVGATPPDPQAGSSPTAAPSPKPSPAPPVAKR